MDVMPAQSTVALLMRVSAGRSIASDAMQ